MATAEHRRNCQQCKERIRRYNQRYYSTFREQIVEQRRRKRQAPQPIDKKVLDAATDVAIAVNRDAIRALS